jgi:hypothetical protein
VVPDKPAGTGAGSGAGGSRPLHEHFAEGRLSLDELQRRVDLVFAAETLIDLYELTSDLPHPGPQLSRRGGTGPGRSFAARKRRWWPFG